MKRAAVALPLLLSVTLVSVAARAGVVVAVPAPRAHPCAGAATVVSDCQPAEKAPHGAPGDRCDPFRSPCASACRLVGWHQDGAALAALLATALSWSESRALPLRRPSNTPDPVPRFDASA